jgi:hypothetical protein
MRARKVSSKPAKPDEMNLTHRVFHHTAAKYTFFSAVHGTFSKISHILGHKAHSINTKK